LSNVVKRELAEGYRRAVVLELGDIEAEAARIISEAEARAAAIIESANKAAAEMGARARSDGHAAGLAAGRDDGLKAGRAEGHRDAFAQARDEILKAAESLAGACTEFSILKENLFKQAESDLLKLSIMIARKITAKEISGDAHITAQNVKRCLDMLSQRKDLVVRVAPQAVAVVQEMLPELSKRLGDLSGVKVVADEEIAPGGCLVTGQSGMLDATIESQFAEVERILFGDGDA